MTRREEYEIKTEQLVQPIMEANHFELVDVEYIKEAGNWFLRVYADKEGGFTVDDCELVSRALSDLMDRDDFIPDSYILEVSSPGLGRPLKKDKDFHRNIGQEVEVKLYQAVNKQKEFAGTLTAYDGTHITITIEEEEKTFDKKEIALIRLAFDF